MQYQDHEKIKYEELVMMLGEPTRIEGNEYLWQCPECLDGSKDNLKFNMSSCILWCFGNKSHRKVYAEILKRRKDIRSLPNKINNKITYITTKILQKANQNINNNIKYSDAILLARGITIDTINDLSIGFGYAAKEENGIKDKTDYANWIFPAYDINNNLLGCEFRSFDFSSIFKTNNLGKCFCKINNPKNPKNLIILEGFIDSYLMYQFLKEHNIHDDYQIFTPSSGVGMVADLLKDLDFNKYKKVILCLDSIKKDKAARDEYKKIKELIKNKYYIFNLPCDCCKDFNDYYLKHDLDVAILKNLEYIPGITICNEFKSLQDTYEEKVEFRYAHPELFPKIPTGFKDLDRFFRGGFTKGEIVGIMARPSMGKTSLLVTLAVNFLKQGLRVGFVSLEMKAENIVELIQFNYLGLSREEITENFNTIGINKIKPFKDNIKNLDFHICDKSLLSLGKVKDIVLEEFKDKTPDVIIIDHMNLVKPDNVNNNSTTYDKATEVYNSLLPFSNKLDSLIIAACQLNRSCESRSDKRPMLSDLSNSGAAEAILEKAIAIYRPYMYNMSMPEIKNDAELIVCKNRDGEIGISNVKFFGDRSIFRDKLDGEIDVSKKNKLPKENSFDFLNDDKEW